MIACGLIRVRRLARHDSKKHFSSSHSFVLTTAEVMSKLQSIAPGFGEYWNDPENLFRADDGSFTFHGMFVEFSHYVREEFELLDEATRVQLFQFAEECAAHRQRSDTELSNAVYTCFIENLTNEPISAQIRSYLGPKSLALFDAWDNPAGPDAA